MLFVKSILSVFVVVLCLGIGKNVLAQSTLFNIPSTDVVAKKKVYLEFDFLSHFEDHADGGFQGYVPRAVVGLGKRTEVAGSARRTTAKREIPAVPERREGNHRRNRRHSLSTGFTPS